MIKVIKNRYVFDSFDFKVLEQYLPIEAAIAKDELPELSTFLIKDGYLYATSMERNPHSNRTRYWFFDTSVRRFHEMTREEFEEKGENK